MNNELDMTLPVFGYTGRVSTKVIKNNRVIKQHSGKNKGLPNLFLALCQMLAGSPTSNAAPARLVLYTYSGTSVQEAAQGVLGTETQDQTTFGTADILTKYWLELDLATALSPLTAPILYTAPPEVTIKNVNSDNIIIPTPQVHFSFKIPYTTIKNAKNIKLAVLFPNKAAQTMTINDALAFYVLKPEEVEPPEGKDNAHLLLDWTMDFTNATGGTK